MLFGNCINDHEANFLSLALLHNLSNNYACLFSKYYLPYYTLFNKIVKDHTNEFFNNSTFNWSPYLSNYSFGKWLKSSNTTSNNQLNEFVDPFKEYIEF